MWLQSDGRVEIRVGVPTDIGLDTGKGTLCTALYKYSRLIDLLFTPSSVFDER